jgi:hypothetical protein
MSNPIFEDFKINVRIKLSALWTGVMFCYIYGDYFKLYVPGKVQGLLNGENMLSSPLKLFIAAFLLSMPAMMIFLSIMMKPKLCKWLNIGVGAFFTLFTLLVGMASVSDWNTFYVCYSFLESIITSVIIWHAWKWPKLKTNLS